MYSSRYFRLTVLRAALLLVFGFSVIMLLILYPKRDSQDDSIEDVYVYHPKICTIAMPATPKLSDETQIFKENGSSDIDIALTSHFNNISAITSIPTIYIITPTYPRMEQMAELTNFGQMLLLVENVHWLLIEDADVKTAEVENLLKIFNIPYTYLLTRMPKKFQKVKKGKPRGVANRLAGMDWVIKYGNDNGVMYFADDDNTYDVRLFEEMRYTKKVSMWPVGLVTSLGVSTPVVRDGRVIGYYDGWIAGRKFPVDMAGFAVNVGFLKTVKNPTMPFVAGYQEDGFLKSLKITMKDIEPKACDCTMILVWHTKTLTNKPAQKMSTKARNKWKKSNLFAFSFIV